MRPNFSTLTSIRGLAAWWVVLYHFRTELPQAQWATFQAFASYGYLAVDLFFIMSGFVIALSYSSVMSEPTWPRVARFLGFRLARIYPLHAVILVAFLLNPIAILLFSTSAVTGTRYEASSFVLSLFLIQNWGFTPDFSWNVPAWSISTEWAAYLLFPLVAWISARFVSQVFHSVAVVVAILLLLALAGHANGGLDHDVPRFGLIRCLAEFSLGMALHRLWLLRRQKFPNAFYMFSGAVCVLAGGVAAHWPDYIYAPPGMLLLIASTLDNRSIGARLANKSVFIYIGEISYSTYLVHYFVKDWVKFLLMENRVADGGLLTIYVCITAAMSVLLYHGIELPGRRLGRHYTELWLDGRRSVHASP